MEEENQKGKEKEKEEEKEEEEACEQHKKVNKKAPTQKKNKKHKQRELVAVAWGYALHFMFEERLKYGHNTQEERCQFR